MYSSEQRYQKTRGHVVAVLKDCDSAYQTKLLFPETPSQERKQYFIDTFLFDGGSLLQQGDEKFCILIDPTSPEDIAQGLETVISQSEVWEDLQKRGCDRVLQCYTWKRTAQEYLKMLEKIVA